MVSRVERFRPKGPRPTALRLAKENKESLIKNKKELEKLAYN